MTRIAIMQPYFIPYAGYFRLFTATDLFVAYDCVQFIRRGWIHRNYMQLGSGETDWLTLPLAKAPQDIKIKNLAFAPDASARWAEQKRRFPLLADKKNKNSLLLKTVDALEGTPPEYIEKTLHTACDILGAHFNVVRSSTLAIPEEIKGQERILAICEVMKAKHYVNAPGGRELYDSATFKKRNIQLAFLPEYQGSYASILHRCLTEEPAVVAQELKAQCQLS